jgi:predicted amidophosphoribosyltransferase
MTYLSMTLKVCEGCGTLWIRSQASLTVYCARCAERLKHFPDPKTRRRPGRPLKHRGVAERETVSRGAQ